MWILQMEGFTVSVAEPMLMKHPKKVMIIVWPLLCKFRALCAYSKGHFYQA